MTEIQRTQYSPHHAITLLTSASEIYQKAKNFNPYLAHRFDQVEVIIQPIATQIYSYGEPLVDKLDNTLYALIHKSKNVVQSVTEPSQLSIQEKKRFYIAAVQAWMTKNLNYDEFCDQIKRLYGTDLPTTLVPYVDHFYKLAKGVQNTFINVPELIAYVMADGADRIHNAFITAWGDLKMITLRNFIERVRKELDNDWNETMGEKAQIFYSVASFESEIKDGIDLAKVQARFIVITAQEVAERTTYLILAAADDLLDWAVDSVDRKFISKFIPTPSYELELKGQDRLWAVQSRIRIELRLALNTRMEEIQSSRVYLKLEHRKESIKSLIDAVKTLKWDDVKDKEWPQQIIETFDNGLIYLGLEKVVIFMKDSLWNKLDHNSDGKLSIEDIYNSAAKAGKINHWKVLYNMLKNYEEEVRKTLSHNIVAVN